MLQRFFLIILQRCIERNSCNTTLASSRSRHVYLLLQRFTDATLLYESSMKYESQVMFEELNFVTSGTQIGCAHDAMTYQRTRAQMWSTLTTCTCNKQHGSINVCCKISLEDYEHVIRDLVEKDNCTCSMVREVLKNNYEIRSGLSQSNIYMCCREHDIHRFTTLVYQCRIVRTG